MRSYEPDFSGSDAPRNPWNPLLHPEQYDYIQNIINYVDKKLVKPPKYDEKTKLEVFRLRDEGLTLRQIAEKTGVSKSTACLYIQKQNKVSKLNKIRVTQPSTEITIEAEYSLNEINVGKIVPKPARAVK